MKFKNISLIFGSMIGMLWLGCGQNAKTAQAEPTQTTQFEWLIGHWQRTNDDAGKTTFEQWQQLSATKYQGLGFTLQGTDTVFKEDIILIQREDKWYFEVRGVNEQPTIFSLSQIDSLSFQCENPANEFPKIIRYSLEGIRLKAVISDGETAVPFVFERLSKE
ncbi:MAG: hypothetical protein AAFN10_06605 [Bacteroidota bacterium]